MKLTGNKIVITGATRGIGFHLLKLFYDQGNEIIAVAKNADLLLKLKERFPNIWTIQCDLSQQKSIDSLIENITKNHQDTNTLINNAGIQINFYDDLFGADQKKLQYLKNEVQVNLIAPIELTHRLIPILIRNPNTCVVQVSSGLAFVPKKSAPVYCGTKAGIHLFSKALRYQYEHTHLKVFEIIPPINLPTSNEKTKEKTNNLNGLYLDFRIYRNYNKARIEFIIFKERV